MGFLVFELVIGNICSIYNGEFVCMCGGEEVICLVESLK